MKPSILLIMADDLGYNDLAINNGNTAIDTPNMDQLAEEGVRFTRHYAAAVCSPARAALLTGLYPERVGYLASGRGISPQITTLPERLQQAGYTTWHIGKWHIGDLTRTAWPDHQGFDHWFGFLNQSRLAGVQVNGVIQLAQPRYTDPWLEGDSSAGQHYPGHLENILTDKAISVLTDLDNAAKPWFLNLWYYAPHTPITPDAEFAAKYPDTPAGKYQALVNQLDHNIGRVLTHLESLGAAQDTIVVVVSDNGGTNAQLDNNWPFYGQKSIFTEGGLRTPLIIRWPDPALNGQVHADTVSIADIAPTLLETAGVASLPDTDGESFYSRLKFGAPATQKARFWDQGSDFIGILSADGRWRLNQSLFTYTLPVWSDLLLDPTGYTNVQPPPAEMALLMGQYSDWYKDVHTVETQYTPSGGGGTLTGMDLLRTPGQGTYTFGLGVPDEVEGQLAAQPGIWSLSRSGDTVMARYGDDTLVLSGSIASPASCHSIVLTGNFRRRTLHIEGPDSVQLSLYIDGSLAQIVQYDGYLDVPDTSVATVIGDPLVNTPEIPAPVILNTALANAPPLTITDFSQSLCAAP